MKKLLVVVLALVVIVGIAATLYMDYGRPQDDVILGGRPDSAVTTSPPEKPAEKPIVVNNEPKYKGQALDFLASSRELANYPKEFVSVQREKLAEVIKLVDASPRDESNWVDIGLVKKVFNNFIGARDAWEYAKLLNPNASMPYYNLGKLYSAYLPDNKKAEENFMAALSLNPSVEYVYLALAEFYHDFYKEKSNQVDEVLLEGLKAMPLDLNLNLQLALYYKEIGDKENAIKYFERFLKLPNLTGTQQKAIEEELAALKS